MKKLLIKPEERKRLQKPAMKVLRRDFLKKEKSE